GVESIYLEAESNRYEFFRDVVEQYRPEIAIITLDSDPNRGLHLVQQLAMEYPNTNILAVSSRTDGPFILQTLRSGAKEFLPLPLQLEDLLTVLERIKAPANDPSSPQQQGNTGVGGIIIAMAGSRGGIGCTSLAVNLGCCLSTLPENKVVLVDLDLALGDTNILLDFRPTYTLSDLASNINEVDQKFLKGVLYQHSSGMMVLPHPENLDDLGLIHEEHILRLLSLLRSTFTHVIVDLSKSFRPTDVAAMRVADIITLVGQLELSSIHNIARLLPTFKSVEGLYEKVRILLNRVGSEDQMISKTKAEEFMGMSVFWQVQNDSKAMLGARNEGKPLIQFAPKSKPCQDLSELARVLTSGVSAPSAPTENKKKSAFSFFGTRK
ncbi:MAG TPA: AAA family ATPase, partial [Gemmatales bacterium]|nr:AAA family ATPase [Gemmatales bacterium]